MIEHKNIFVDGRWIPSTASAVLTVTNPVTEEPIATVPRGTAEDVDRAAQAAARAFAGWSRSTVQQRTDIFHELARLTEARAQEITRTIVTEVGYPFAAAHRSQTIGAVEELDLIAETLAEITWAETMGTANVCRVPSGVVGAITAWNAPLRSIISKAGAAIAAGCTVVLKPAEVAPLTAFLFAELCAEAGLPPGVLNLVCGTGPEVGEAIAAHPLVDMVSLTGSVRAGQRVMEVGAPTIKRMHLELGGKSANIIFADVDLARAVNDGIEDAMRNTGQVCGGLSRMLVQRQRLNEAEELAVRRARAYRLGDPFDPATTLGPVVSGAARERVRGYIRSGLEQGVRMLTGGPEAQHGLERGYFVQPTVFSGDNHSRIAREEIFGPVLAVIPYEGEEEAIRIANDSEYGLSGTVWTKDVDRGIDVARRVRTGTYSVNGFMMEFGSPFGGFKASGVGREMGPEGLRAYLEPKSISLPAGTQPKLR